MASRVRAVRPAAVLAGLAGLILADLALIGWLLPRPGYWAVKLLLSIAAAALAGAVWSRLGRGNREVARFIAAIGHADLTQGFRTTGGGPGLDELGAAMDDAMTRLRRERAEAAADNRFASALVDEAPTPLLVIGADGTVHLANKAARHLFREADGRAIAAFARYGEDFAALLATIAPGVRAVCRVRWNGLSHRAVAQASSVERRGAAARIVSLDLIQSELDAAEVAVQTDLVRVLTHEIMNSLTPVVSLAGSAAGLLAEAEAGEPGALAEARAAVDALARRSAGIAGFVDSYRDFSRTPTLHRARFALGPWIEGIAATFRASPQGARTALAIALPPGDARVDADEELLSQVLINLLKNAGEAADADDPRVAMRAERNEAGRLVLTIEDNGAGVAAGLEDEIFLPFFTTKRGGTGVGLSFARQVATLHGGSIGVTRGPLGGAAFVLVL